MQAERYLKRAQTGKIAGNLKQITVFCITASGEPINYILESFAG